MEQYPGSKDKGDVTTSRPKGVAGGNLPSREPLEHNFWNLEGECQRRETYWRETRTSVERIRGINTSNLLSSLPPISYKGFPLDKPNAKLERKASRAQSRVKKGRGSGGTQTPKTACLALAHDPSAHQHSREPTVLGRGGVCGIIGVWLPFYADLQAKLCFPSSCHFPSFL